MYFSVLNAIISPDPKGVGWSQEKERKREKEEREGEETKALPCFLCVAEKNPRRAKGFLQFFKVIH